MAAEHEPAKMLLPYLQRADELQKHEPLVAYYCRLYAMDRGLRIPQSERTKTTNALLGSLIKQLEKDKKLLSLGPEDNLHLEGFALSVFAKADKQDRAGRADLNTAKTFYAASIFFEILSQFGTLQPDLEQKQKYAVWKAADIRKALKEGRKPVAGPPSGDDDLSLPSISPSESFGVGTNLGAEVDSSPQVPERLDRQHSANISGSSSASLPSSSYPSQDFHQSPPPPAITKSESLVYSSSYHQPHQQEPQGPQHHLPQNYPSDHLPPNYNSAHLPPNYPPEHAQAPHSYSSEPQQHLPYNYYTQSQQHVSTEYPSRDNNNSQWYPHFQSYPSFTESSLPSVPSQDPSYYQGSESSLSAQLAHSAKNYPVAPQYSSGGRNGAVSEAAQSPPPKIYEYDCNYQPPPEKIAEAHKAARFAVGALAFDDVSVAVDFLKKSLELLTNPSAGQ